MPVTETERLRVYLDKVHLKGFKSIEDLTIDIQKGLTILIGKNGAGKSNFLEFLNQTIQYRGDTRLLFKYARLEYLSDDIHSFVTEIERDLYAKFDRDNLSERLGVSERFYIDGEVIYNTSGDSGQRKQIEFKGKKYTHISLSLHMLPRLGYRFIYPTFIEYSIPAPLDTIELPGVLKANIEDDAFFWSFPNTISSMHGIFQDLDEFYGNEADKLNNVTSAEVIQHLRIDDEVFENVIRYTPIEDLRFNPNLNIYNGEKSLIIENIKLDFKINGNWLPWSQLSDGTKRLFYVISEVTYNNGIILIEEPELGIHPHQFNLLMDFLKEQSEDKQIVISTHSPKALDHLSPDELNNILIAYYDLAKGTQIRHITEQEEKKAKRYMKEVGFLSDYWLLSDLE